MSRKERARITLRLEPELVEILKGMKVRRHVSLNEVVAQIVRDKLCGTERKESRRILMHRLDELAARQEKQHALLERQRLRLELLVLSFFCLTRRAPEEERSANVTAGRRRYDDFAAELTRRIEKHERESIHGDRARGELFPTD